MPMLWTTDNRSDTSWASRKNPDDPDFRYTFVVTGIPSGTDDDGNLISRYYAIVSTIAEINPAFVVDMQKLGPYDTDKDAMKACEDVINVDKELHN